MRVLRCSAMTDILSRLRRPTIPESCKSTCLDAAEVIERQQAVLSDLVAWAAERPQIDPSPIGHICQRARRCLAGETEGQS
jgi:hypothetical protein